MFGTERVKSSLTDGYAFKTLLGNKRWQEVIPRGECPVMDLKHCWAPAGHSERELRSRPDDGRRWMRSGRQWRSPKKAIEGYILS